MYFAINGFITTVCIVSLILFTEMFPKIIKGLISLVAIFTSSYAIAILIKKIGEWTSLYPAPADVFPNFYYVLPCVAVLAVVIAFVVNKKKK
ncbi:MAG: hypothetical protein ACK5LC_09815 [Coprobacillaceae bacterium]